MSVKLHTKDLLIFENRNDNYEFQNKKFPYLMYYFIKDYKYENNKLQWVTIDIIIDIKEYFEGENKDLYTLTLSDKISDDVREDVAYYKSKR